MASSARYHPPPPRSRSDDNSKTFFPYAASHRSSHNDPRRRTTRPTMQAALSALPVTLANKLSSATNTYELLPPTPQDSPLLPGEVSRPKKRTTRRRWLLLLPTAFVLAGCFGWFSGSEGSLGRSSILTEDAHVDSDTSVDHSGDLTDGHPRFLLPPTPLRPSPQPLPYPAPPTSCLLHLYTLADTSDFDPTLCDLSDSLEPIGSVVTFVNGTGDLFLSAYEASLASVNEGGGNVKPAKRHYSNMGELRFSLRSVGRNLVGKRLEEGRVHGIGSDFPSPDVNDTARYGQIPQWLDWDLVRRPAGSVPDPNESPAALANEEPDPLAGRALVPSPPSEKPKSIAWSFHSEIFQGDDEWKAKALPTFNSFAIESQIHNVDSLSPTFISLNDDFMILRPMTASDFHTSLFGPVLKVQEDLKVTGKGTATVGDAGEWGGLEWAAWILNHRHPSTGLEYLNHLPKTLTQVHLHELSITFKDALGEASLRKFREQKTHGPDIEIAFLATHYIRQRFREALIFSFVVARPASATGSVWGRREKEELRSLGIDGWRGRVGVVEGKQGWTSEKMVDAFEKAGTESPLATEYKYTSASGLPRNPFVGGMDFTLSLADCLGPWWTSNDDDLEIDSTIIFRRLAFENIVSQCGGLLITAVLDKSSEPGLTSLLPRKGTYFEPRQPASPADVRPNIYSVPHLPLTPTWQEANFSLSSLFPSWNGLSDEGVDIQSWTVDLLGRYRYSLGSSPSHFTSIRSTFSMNSLEKYLDANEQLALLALNDDIPATYSEERRSDIKRQLHTWGEERWPGREVWEADDA